VGFVLQSVRILKSNANRVGDVDVNVDVDVTMPTSPSPAARSSYAKESHDITV
jgi:hypothetical protein